MDKPPLDSEARPPLSLPDLSPEARRRHAVRLREDWQEAIDSQIGPLGRFWHSKAFRVLGRVWTGAWHDGFIHAGNLAYMSDRKSVV